MNKKIEKKEKTRLLWILLVSGLSLVLSGNSSAYNVEGGGVCNCLDCVDCSSALNDNSNCYTKVKLTSDIINYALTCINNPANFSNKIFDCGGHKIYGDYSGGGSGFVLSYKNNISIRNCAVSGFWHGIYITHSSGINISENIINANLQNGIYMEFSESSKIANNTINSNSFGIEINDSYCVMKYNITPDTVIFYHANWCPHCNNMKPWIRQLEGEGYKFHWAEYRDSSAMGVINECMPVLKSGGFPHFGCTSNGKDHLGEFRSIEEMRNFAEECRKDTNRYSADINSNMLCSNIISDFKIIFSLNHSGYNNTCSNPDGWNDNEATGCTYSCPPPACTDGTPYGQCSSNKPKYCSDGNLTDNCALCGCPSGQNCGSDGSCYNPTCVIPGDADGNCIINIFDVIWAEKIAVGLPGPSGGNADANCDGTVNIFDVIWIERIAVGLPGIC